MVFDNIEQSLAASDLIISVSEFATIAFNSVRYCLISLDSIQQSLAAFDLIIFVSEFGTIAFKSVR